MSRTGESMPRNSEGRVLFDISTSMRWTGPPVGIVRVERELALWAHANVHNVAFVFFDPEQLAYREVRLDVVPFLTGEAALDTIGLTNPARPGRRRTDAIPATLKPAFLWVVQFGRMMLRRLEIVRLTTRRAWAGDLADRLQRQLMSQKYRKLLIRPDETRRPFFPYDMAVGARVELQSGDVLICAGSGWGHTNIGALRDMKARSDFRLILLCHDLIPLLFPHFYRDYEVRLFRTYMHQALAIADRVVFSCRKMEADCRAYCAREHITLRDTAVVPFGFEVRANGFGQGSQLPAGLEAGRFALLVSTIEPRKGHAMLYRVWRRLLAEGVPQSKRFKLVFVGRPGWMVETLMSDLRNDRQVAGSIIIISDIGDDVLASLYAAAAFCVYPSEYEGYGLPVVEAFAHGKAVLASNGGAVPELVQDFSPCLDPNDEEAWHAAIGEWIVNVDARRSFELAIRSRFRHPNWSEAAALFFANLAAEPPMQRDTDR
jgi:glycosyltransferase involved in cell wall biosynthesis